MGKPDSSCSLFDAIAYMVGFIVIVVPIILFISALLILIRRPFIQSFTNIYFIAIIAVAIIMLISSFPTY